MKKPVIKKNLRSEAAIKRVIKEWNDVRVSTGNTPTVTFWRMTDNDGTFATDEVLAKLDLRDFIKKRKPLTGVKKQLDAIVRGKKTK
jgi:hypothetical protein